MNMTKSEIITLFYKIFIVLMIIIQLYILLFTLIDIYTKIVNISLVIYFIFRYYLLTKLTKEAATLNITLNELLEGRKSRTCNCKCGSEFNN